MQTGDMTRRHVGWEADVNMSTVLLGSARSRNPRLVAPLTIAAGSRFLRRLLVGLDAVGLTLAWSTVLLLAPANPRAAVDSAVVTIVLVLGSLIVFDVVGLYLARVCHLRSVEYVRLARSLLIVGFVALGFVAGTGTFLAPREIVLGSFLALVLVSVLRSGYRSWLTGRRRAGSYLRSVLLVGAATECAQLAALLREQPEIGYRAIAVVGDERDARFNGLHDEWAGDLSEGLAVVAETGVTGAIVCGADLRSSDLNTIVQDLLHAGVHVQLSSGLHGVGVGRLRPSPLAYEPYFYVEPVTLAGWQLATKRAIDVVLSVALLALTAPLLGLTALGVKLQDRGPVLFKQLRVGRDGATFVLYKFRTMHDGAQDVLIDLIQLDARDGPLTKIPQDPRVTPLGRILRATSIDELPQLWNVLNGTMSLVGPRPALPDEVAKFDAELRAREAVPPGITGLWQVEGRDNPSFGAYRRFDLFYLENWSVSLDIVILLSTVEAVITRVFRGLLHLDQDIQLAPPEVRDPNRQEARRRDRRPSEAPSSVAVATEQKAMGARS